VREDGASRARDERDAVALVLEQRGNVIASSPSPMKSSSILVT